MTGIRQLPDNPQLDHLRSEARSLQRAFRAGDAGARAVAVAHLPAGRVADSEAMTLSTAQWLVARSYGFPSWNRLRRHLEIVAALSRSPEPAADTVPSSDDPAAWTDHFLRLSVLNYTRDDPRSFIRARELLARRPGLATADVFTMVVTGAVDELGRLLADDPAAARVTGGPYDWPPLLYLGSARIADDRDQAPPIATRLLLDAGADPNTGYLWRGLPSAFTALTCVLGGGEQNQPPHPAAIPIGRLLLEAGADPNDNQALYNRMFSPADDHLVLLFEYGLGRDRPSVWRDRLGSRYPSPEQMLGEQLRWAAAHGFVDRIRLLLDHGVDPDSRGYHPIHGDRSAAELAASAGHQTIVDLLRTASRRHR